MIYRAPPNSGELCLGKTLPELLDDACDRYPNEQALNQWQKRQWRSLSNTQFRYESEAIALGWLSLGLNRGDRVGLMMQNDISFCLVDMSCLLAGLIDVPIDLTQTIENIIFILQHSETKILVISNLDLLYQILPYLTEKSTLQGVIIASVPDNWDRIQAQLVHPTIHPEESSLAPPDDCLQIPHLLGEGHPSHTSPNSHLPRSVWVRSLTDLQQQGEAQWHQAQVDALRSQIQPHDLATILYIASETKRPKGVMLSHENISADILAAFSSFPNLATGSAETALIFLPLTHIFARAFLYGHLAYGHSIYFSDPNHLIRHLKLVNPTVLITVPRLLEKLYERIVEQGQRLGRFDQRVFQWALKLAHRFEIGRSPSRLFRLQLKLAERLVYGKWRAIFGDRMKALICGGAALRSDLANVFTAAGVPLLQGYGLTETSAVLCYNRGEHNRAGTVGKAIPGVEITLANDSEILIKSPFVMQGYYKDPTATQAIIDTDGWLHTGDLGYITDEGFLQLIGVKKNLFKLSTGKYVSPLPLEQELMQSPLVAHAVTVGAGHKFCGMLIFPQYEAIQDVARTLNIEITDDVWLSHPCLQALYQDLIDQANCHLPYWSTVRKFQLVNADLTIVNGLLNPDGSINRNQVIKAFSEEISRLYRHDTEIQSLGSLSDAAKDSSHTASCPIVPAASCPIYAKSLIHY
mgnify:FL=1